MGTNPEFAALFRLDRAERLQLVEDLWDSIAEEDASNLPAPDWKRDELRQRKARFLQHPEAGQNWAEVQHAARSRLTDG